MKILVVAVAVGLVLGQAGKEVVKGDLTLPQAALVVGSTPPVFDLEGVCAVDDKSVSCWDSGGRPLPSLAAPIERQLREFSFSLDFVPGRKNRFVVVHARPHAWSRILSDPSVRQYTLAPDEATHRTLMRIAVPSDEKVGTLDLEVGAYQGTPIDVPLREGARARVDGLRVEIGPVQKNPDFQDGLGRFADPFSGGMWRVALDQPDTEASDAVACEAIGRDGLPIDFVDPHGKPLPVATYDRMRSHAATVDWSHGPLLGVAFVGRTLPRQSLWLGTNVDPRSIAKLRLKHVVPVRETLGPFALDPQPSGP